MDTERRQQVRRRKTFYLPGFDPFPARRYRELYRIEGTTQAEISGYSLTLTGTGGTRWTVEAKMDGCTTHSEFEVLEWADIVRSSMSRSIPATYAMMLRTTWIYLSSGALWRLMRLRKGPVIAALYPIAILFGQLLVALLVGWLVWFFLSGIGSILAVVPAIGAVWGLLRMFRRYDNRVFAYYLMHDYAHSAKDRGRTPADMLERLANFEERLLEATGQGWDEILVVGHSSGAHLAVQVLASLIRSGRIPSEGTISFLSLGQVVPMVSFLPEAHDLRADLSLLSAQDRVPWVDVTAPGDGCAFALCDPVLVSGVAPPAKRWPLVLSASFTKTLSSERWRELRWRFFRLHFQYLCAFDRPGDYDYFAISAGPKTLEERFEDRQASPSRIETPVNRYTSVAA